MYYNLISEDYLIHHGVKGMKWGVRKEAAYQAKGTANGFYDIPNRGKNLIKYGWKQGHGKNVHNRIQQVKSDKKRMSRMNVEQKQSLKNADKYWSNRAAGKGIRESGERNLIKRGFDAHRSKSRGYRNTVALLRSIGPNPVAQLAGNAASEVGGEFVNKMFGHF